LRTGFFRARRLVTIRKCARPTHYAIRSLEFCKFGSILAATNPFVIAKGLGKTVTRHMFRTWFTSVPLICRFTEGIHGVGHWVRNVTSSAIGNYRLLFPESRISFRGPVPSIRGRTVWYRHAEPVLHGNILPSGSMSAVRRALLRYAG